MGISDGNYAGLSALCNLGSEEFNNAPRFGVVDDLFLKHVPYSLRSANHCLLLIIRLDNNRDNEHTDFVAKLADEIRMKKPFALAEEEAALNIFRTAEYLGQRTSQALKSFDLTGPQYNVLRILRGSLTEGLSCSQIAERMINRDPDITRLLDRLQSRGLILRERGGKDRRVVTVNISPEGMRLLQESDPVIESHHRRQFSHLHRSQLQQLIELLELVRNPPESKKESSFEDKLRN